MTRSNSSSSKSQSSRHIANHLKCCTDLIMLYQFHIWCQEVNLYVSIEGTCVQSSAQTERAARMQGWMNIQWRQPEEDLQDDVSRKVPLHTPPLPMKLRTQAFHHTFSTQRYISFVKWGCFSWTVKCYYFQFAGLMLRVEHSLERGIKLSVDTTQLIYRRFEKHIHEWSLSLRFFLTKRCRYEVNPEW